MKKSSIHLRRAKLNSFTLIELLVVMAIIVILASVILTAGGPVLNSARRVKAANLANQLQTATLAYYTDYSVYPVPASTGSSDWTNGDVAADATAWGNLVEALSGNIKPSTGAAATQTSITNSHGTAYLSLRATDVDANDAPLNPVPTGTEIYFNIAINSSYSGVLGAGGTGGITSMPAFTNSSPTSLSLTGGTSTAGVAVWANCNGKTSSQNAFWWVHTY